MFNIYLLTLNYGKEKIEMIGDPLLNLLKNTYYQAKLINSIVTEINHNVLQSLLVNGLAELIDFSDINKLIKTSEFCNQLPIHQRHPYAGLLVHTAFSGSHQDAIRKGMDALSKSNDPFWEVPYLPIDPNDIGRTYEAIIRVNSQSGKAGAAWLLEQEHNINIPKGAQVQFSQSVQSIADKTGKEITSDMIWDIFEKEFLRNSKYSLLKFKSKKIDKQRKSLLKKNFGIILRTF